MLWYVNESVILTHLTAPVIFKDAPNMEEKRQTDLHGVKILLLVSILLITTTTVDAHGYLASPRSRNFVAYEDGKWFGGDNTTPFPEPEPQSANIGGVRAVCGIIAATRNYDIPTNVHGTLLVGVKPQAYYQCGQIIDLSVILTAHHKGHFVSLFFRFRMLLIARMI
jgi:hypothetical protein